MREFALQCLEEKYGKKFVIDETYCRYKHWNGEEDNPMVLRARAYPEDDESNKFGLFVKEPNVFQDNYSVQLYQHDIEAEIFPEMEKFGLEGTIVISYPLMTGTIRDDLSADDIIYDGSTCICFFPGVAKESDISVYIPTIRKWLDFLYTCDYDWYFALTDEDDMSYQFIGISKGDHGFTASSQWTDEEFMDMIKWNISRHEED